MHRASMRWVVALAMAATAAVAVGAATPTVAGATCTAASKWPCHGGDPRGRVLRTLRVDVYSAARLTGDSVAHRSYDSYWIPDGGCGFGRTGWSQTMAMATFATALRRTALTQRVGRALTREGWKSGPVTNEGQTDVAGQWDRTLLRQVASIQLWKVQSGRGVIPTMTGDVTVLRGQSGWVLAAGWQPQPAGTNCP